MCVKGAAPAATVAGFCLLLLIGAAPSAEPQTFSVSASTTSVGFAVLVILARDTIPIRGWYDSFALGAILGMLGDEDLLGKLKIK